MIGGGANLKRTVAGIALALGLFALAPSAGAKATLYAGGLFGPPYGVAALDVTEAGSATALPGSPFQPLNGLPNPSVDGVALTRDGEQLVATSAGSAQVMLYSVSPDGALAGTDTFLYGAASPDPDPDSLAIVGDGIADYAFVADGNRHEVLRFEVDEGFGLIAAPPAAEIPGADLDGVAATPDGRHLFVASNDEKRIYAFSIGDGGRLTPLSPAFTSTDANPADITITPDGDHLFVGNTNTTGIDAFSIGAGGRLEPVSGSPFPSGGDYAESVAASPSGTRLYASTDAGAAVLAYDVGVDGSLSQAPGSPFASAGHEVDAVAVSTDSSTVFAAGGTTAANLTTYGVGATGELVRSPGSPFSTGTTLPDHWGLATRPVQPPVASFTVAPDPATSTATFDASASSDPDGTVERYRWEFGDGSTAATSVPTISHAYPGQGSYNAKLTLIDDEGCSTDLLYTGQTASCNGGPRATADRLVDLQAATPPEPQLRLRLAGRMRQRLGRTLRVRATCSIDCRVVATGKVTRKRNRAWRTVRGFGLRRLKADLAGGQPRVLRLRVPKSVKRRGNRMLRRGVRLRAAIRVNTRAGERRIAARTRFVKLYR